MGEMTNPNPNFKNNFVNWTPEEANRLLETLTKGSFTTGKELTDLHALTTGVNRSLGALMVKYRALIDLGLVPRTDAYVTLIKEATRLGEERRKEKRASRRKKLEEARARAMKATVAAKAARVAEKEAKTVAKTVTKEAAKVRTQANRHTSYLATKETATAPKDAWLTEKELLKRVKRNPTWLANVHLPVRKNAQKDFEYSLLAAKEIVAKETENAPPWSEYETSERLGRMCRCTASWIEQLANLHGLIPRKRRWTTRNGKNLEVWVYNIAAAKRAVEAKREVKKVKNELRIDAETKVAPKVAPKPVKVPVTQGNLETFADVFNALKRGLISEAQAKALFADIKV